MNPYAKPGGGVQEAKCPAAVAPAVRAGIEPESSRSLSPNARSQAHTTAPVNPKEQAGLNAFPVLALQQKPTTPKRRIEWNQSEIDAVAKEFVACRAADPFESPVVLSHRAQESALPEHRRRKLISVPSSLRVRIAQHWETMVAKEAGEKPPLILTVEVPKPFDYTEALASVDSATLVALLVGKLGKEMGVIQSLLTAITERTGSRPTVAPSQASKIPAVFAKAEKRKPRVAVIGPLPGQMIEIRQRVEEAELPVELRFVDKEASSTGLPASCDFAIVTRHTRHKWWESARQKLDNGRVHFVDGGIGQVVQKLRDICSRQ